MPAEAVLKQNVNVTDLSRRTPNFLNTYYHLVYHTHRDGSIPSPAERDLLVVRQLCEHDIRSLFHRFVGSRLVEHEHGQVDEDKTVFRDTGMVRLSSGTKHFEALGCKFISLLFVLCPKFSLSLTSPSGSDMSSPGG